MNTSLWLRSCRMAGAAFLLMAGLAACSTGNDEGDVNVERGSTKDAIEPGTMGGDEPDAKGADSARMSRDTAISQQERQYQRARYSKDRDRNGIAN